MEVTVKLFAGWAAGVPHSTLSVSMAPGATVGDLLQRLAELDPELCGRLRAGIADGYVQVLVDGRNVRFLEGDRTLLTEGVTVAFLPPVAGG